MNETIDSFYTFYLENWGWLICTILVGILFILVLIDSQRRSLGAVGWLAGIFVCLLAFIPAGIYAIGPQEARDTLRDTRAIIFYLGLLATIVPFVIVIGYLLSYMGQKARGRQPDELQGIRASQPIIIASDSEDRTRLQHDAPEPSFGVGAAPTSFAPEKSSQTRGGAASSPARPLANAWFVDTSDGERAYQLCEGDTAIGRAPQNDIVIPDPAVARKHLLVRQHKDQFFVQDIGSSTGTLLNGVDLTEPRLLQSNDVVTIGDTQIRFVM